jgi:hypothetical protein
MIDSETWKVRVGRNGKPEPRPKSGKFGPLPTPCGVCPRDKPANEAATTLSEKNWRAWAYYQKTRATFGRYLDGRPVDELSAQILSICDQTVRSFELELRIHVGSMSAAKG